MSELAWIGGRFLPINEAKVSVEDRAYQFGDGVYEVVAAYGGAPFLLDRHLDRLQRSAAAIVLDARKEIAALEALILEGVQRCGLGDTLVYIQLSRGVAPRSHVIPASIEPVVVLTFRRLPVTTDALRSRGLRAMTIRDNRWANCSIKAITLLPNILAKNEALRRGFDEAIYVTDQDEVTECTAANIFLVKNGALVTPPRTEAILHGVTQSVILECAADAAIPCREGRCDLALLRSAEEVFLSSTTAEVLGVTSVDERPVGDGNVGPVTSRLFAALQDRVRRECTIPSKMRREQPDETVAQTLS